MEENKGREGGEEELAAEAHAAVYTGAPRSRERLACASTRSARVVISLLFTSTEWPTRRPRPPKSACRSRSGSVRDAVGMWADTSDSEEDDDETETRCG